MAKKSVTASPTPPLGAFQDEVRRRAEEIFHQRTRDNRPGDDLSDWLEAENEVKKKYKLK